VIRSSRTRRPAGALALAIALAMVAGACGSRANEAQVNEALGRIGSSRTAGLTAGDRGGTGDAAGAGLDAATTDTATDTGGDAATASNAGATGGGAAATNTAGGAGDPTSAAPAGGNGGATDVGVTADSITVANISILTGPVPGLFAGAAYGTDAFLAYQNSQGGVFGRKLKLLVGDDQFDCGRNRAITEQYASKAFAFVGGFTLYDNCGAEYLSKHPEVPDVHNALARDAGKLPNNFSPSPVRAGAATGPFLYAKSKAPDAVGATASLVGDVQSAKDAWVGQKYVLQQLGYNIKYERLYSPTETDFTSDIVRMRTGGIKTLVLIAADAKSIARILAAADQQGFKPEITLVGASGYDQQVLKLASAKALEGVMLYLPTAMYLGEDNQPEVQLFLSWLKKTHPSASADLFTVYGWASARLFVQALQAAGPMATRAGILASLKKIDDFDSNGLLAKTGPASKRPATCYAMITIHNGKYQRLDPASGYRCDGQYVYLPGA
jgi:ABC-type branched-subunit amino acid transport system substrate-binding protein